MKIKDVICSAGVTGFYFDDQRAIKNHGVVDGAMYQGAPITPGFHAIRQKGESISVMLVLEDGQIAYGDCAAVQYSGAGGRDPLFVAETYIDIIEKYIKPVLVGEKLDSFRRLAVVVDSLMNPETNTQFHTAIRYGITQALLDGVAKSKRQLMVEVIADEYDLEISETPIKIFTQSGDDRYLNVDKMIIKEAAVLPHGLINHVPSKLGEHGEILLDYITWLRQRILDKRLNDAYHPIIHIDVYGTLGMIFDLDHMVAYMKKAEAAAHPFELYVEGPMDVEDKDLQIKHMQKLRSKLEAHGSKVKIVADEWCNTLGDIKDFVDAKAGHVIQIKTPDLGGINNTIEAILYCKAHGMLAYLGGTCNETDRSSQISVHIALATQPDQMLAKPGMGVDEGYMITYNEMARTLALLKRR
ncbi:MAG: methylaspartate ammonia-lyase [Erysipelothrix sp.]|jgi:methylaspartate ammonia-lyase|nr:methylaspartate ammonia-lyase [Erysipelothrix sp.]